MSNLEVALQQALDAVLFEAELAGANLEKIFEQVQSGILGSPKERMYRSVDDKDIQVLALSEIKDAMKRINEIPSS